jgi:hypothetical protein
MTTLHVRVLSDPEEVVLATLHQVLAVVTELA